MDKTRLPCVAVFNFTLPPHRSGRSSQGHPATTTGVRLHVSTTDLLQGACCASTRPHPAQAPTHQRRQPPGQPPSQPPPTDPSEAASEGPCLATSAQAEQQDDTALATEGHYRQDREAAVQSCWFSGRGEALVQRDTLPILNVF
jgi:hypothetical protein